MLPHRRFPDGLDGNFTAYVPRQLTSFDLRLAAAPPEAIGFPGKLTYCGRRPGLTSEALRHFVAEYRPRFETFIQAGACRKLTYVWAAGGPFHLDVLHNRESGDWNIYKFRAGVLLSHVAAQGYGEAIIRASAAGLEPEEPAFTFAGDPEECRRENRAQLEFLSLDETEHREAGAAGESGRQTLAFGVVAAAGAGSLIFIPMEKARELAAIQEALRAKTWGEFRLKMPASRLPELLNTLLECGAWASFDFYYQAHAQSSTRAERDLLWNRYQQLAPGARMPFDDDPFQIEVLAGLSEGNWPERPQQAMLRWLPPLICGRLGRRVFSHRCGDSLIFDPARAPEILSALEDAGYLCCWEEDLVRRACGRKTNSAL